MKSKLMSSRAYSNLRPAADTCLGFRVKRVLELQGCGLRGQALGSSESRFRVLGSRVWALGFGHNVWGVRGRAQAQQKCA